MNVALMVIGIILFIGLIVVHEWGHFIVARRNGVEVEEFGIFFPPRLYKRKVKTGWTFSFNLIPLGGFVKLKGEHDSDTEKGSFGAASTWSKSKIMAAGVAMNLVVALVLFTILALIGMPQLVDNQFSVKNNAQLVSRKVIVTYVEPGSPAAKAGLKAEDQINDIALAGYSPVGLVNAKQLPQLTKQFAGKTAYISYTRSGHNYRARTTFLSNQVVAASRKTNNPKANLGVIPKDITLQRYTWSAPVVAIGFSAQLTALTFQGLGHALGGLGSLVAGAITGNHAARENGQTSASSQVSGPIGIVYILKTFSLLGYQFVLFVIAYISLILAVMNILPIPALDGGRLWIMLISRGLKRPLSAKAEEAVNATGFLVLMGLFILISIVDVQRFF